MKTKEIIDRIFKEPGIKYELTEFGLFRKDSGIDTNSSSVVYAA